jgi:hypothetical protein
MCETPAGFIAAVPGSDRLFDLFDPFLQIAELIGTARMAIRASGRMRMSASSFPHSDPCFRQDAHVGIIIDDGDQLGNPPDTQRRHDPEFAGAASDQIRQHWSAASRGARARGGASDGLLLGRLDCREPHRRATDHFANRFLIEHRSCHVAHMA